MPVASGLFNVPVPVNNPRQSGFIPDARAIGYQVPQLNIGGDRGATIPSLEWLDQRTHTSPFTGAAPLAPLSPGRVSAGQYSGTSYAQPAPTRNPAIQKALNEAYAGLSLPPPATTISSATKNPAQAARVSALSQQAAGTQPVKNQNIADFVKELIANKPKNQAALEQERNSVNRVYTSGPGSLEGDLGDARTRRSRAVRAATVSALNRARRENNAGRMLKGNSSYLDRAYNDSAQRILTDQALANTGNDREDIMYLQGQRGNMLGARQNLSNSYLDSLVNPNRTLNSLQGQEQDLVGNMGQMEDQNTYYDYMTPERAFALRMSGLDSIDRLSGMQEPVPWSVPGEGPYRDPVYDDQMYYPMDDYVAPAPVAPPVYGPAVADHPEYQFLDSLAHQAMYNPGIYGADAIPQSPYFQNPNMA